MEPNFDDGLSEDWVSQPRSSDISAPPDDASILRRSTSASRIPLPKSQSLSSLPKTVPGQVLSEKTNSALNIERGNAPSKLREKKKLKESQTFTDESLSEESGSVLVGTIQHKTQEEGAEIRQATPEWKRRLLNSRGAAGKQQGLFSPSGLENVFRPPTVRKQVSVPLRRAKTMATPSSIPPSSPPMLPSRRAPSSAMHSPDDSVQLPPLPPMPRNIAKSRRVSRVGSRMSSGKSYLQHESFSPVPLPPTDTESMLDEVSIRVSLQNLRPQDEKEKSRPASSMSDGALDMRGSQLALEEQQGDTECTSTSLPDHLEPESGAYPFVTMRRGGFSSDGSFQRRPLSPSSFQPLSTPTLLPTERKELGTNPDPQTPRPAPRNRDGAVRSREDLGSSGSPQKLSPLKLFDKHDTFTNDRLSRRISQFEAGDEGAPEEVDPFENQLDSTLSPRKKQSSENQHDIPAQIRKKRMSSFGDGMLDQYDFTHSPHSPDTLRWPHDADIAVQSDSALPYTVERTTQRTIFKNVETYYQRNTGLEEQQAEDLPYDVDESEPLPDGKRQRSSPQKIPNAKRRRTINAEVQENLAAQVQKQRPSLSQNSSMAGKKRKDARYDNSSQTADPETIATRPILRPKARQQSISEMSRQSSVAKTAATVESVEQLIDLEAATGVLAGELANLALNVAEGISHGVRKKSVTTADFFREANLIMQNLRSNAVKREDTSQSLLSEIGPLPGIEESAGDIFSTDNFSRPPSREGSPARRKVPGPKEFRIISRLRKFEDTDDIGLALNSSFQGIPERNQGDVASESFQSEPSNIRILDPPRKSNYDSRTGTSSNQAVARKEKTGEPTLYPSSKSSSNRSVQTGSSGTHTKAVIAPEKVSHLITGNMGRMTFDEEKGCWIKRKSFQDQRAPGEVPESEATEDDPFREIPDLDVDESQELKTMRTTVTSCVQLEEPSKEMHSINKRTQPRSDPVIKTQVTSSGTSDKIDNETESPPTKSAKYKVATVHAETSTRSKQPRVVTVTFSSPLVQPALPGPTREDDEPSELEFDVEQRSREASDSPGYLQRNSERRPKGAKALYNKLSSRARCEPLRRALSRIEEGEKTPSPVHPTDASDADLAVALATPQNAVRKVDGALSAPSAARSYVALQLTPLSDFTVHHADESLNLDVQYIAKRGGLASIHEIEGRFSLSIKDLVEKIADVEPYEPYWEHMRALQLQDRGLLTLHMLDDFCSRIEELDVSGNELGQLNGAPQCLRILDAQKNCLSSLTAWGHLYNLQYLDVSSNEIDSLTGLRELVHLRELRADHNQIDNLEGILQLNGLLKLNVGNNSIKALDFHGSDLKRLTDLDVSYNEITKVNGLGHLPVLERLVLRKNRLAKISFQEEQGYPMRILDVSENELCEIDVSRLVHLQDLLLDSNGVARIDGLANRSSPRRISWQTQKLSKPEADDTPPQVDYSCCVDALNLSLAGTRLVRFSPCDVFLGLERLDLASCGLDSLIKDFGQFLPNVRHLNLNYNAIQDVKPLAGIRKLTALYIAGNRIIRYRRSMEAICKIGRHLQILDCRNNPFTAGFYIAPHLETASRKLVLKSEDAPNNVGRPDQFDASAYIAPDADSGADGEYIQNLDFGTRIRRRVYELMLLKCSRSLRKLDGLSVDEKRILTVDGIWERLIELEVVQLEGTPEDE